MQNLIQYKEFNNSSTRVIRCYLLTHSLLPEDMSKSKDDIHQDDIHEIERSFWNEKEIPEMGDIVEIQDGNTIRSYVYTKSSWLFQNEVRIIENDENNDGSKITSQNATRDLTRDLTKDLTKDNSTNTDDNEGGDHNLDHNLDHSIVSTTKMNLLDTLQQKIDKFCQDRKIKSTKGMELLRELVQDFIDTERQEKEIQGVSQEVTRQVSQGVTKEVSKESPSNVEVFQEVSLGVTKGVSKDVSQGVHGDQVSQIVSPQEVSQGSPEKKPSNQKKNKTKKTASGSTTKTNNKTDYNIFMSKCLLRLKEEHKEILPSQRMGVAVGEWQKYKASTSTSTSKSPKNE